MSIMILPKPVSYYQLPTFEGDRATAVEASYRSRDFHLFSDDEALVQRLAAQLDLVTFSRAGRLKGEYVFINRGCLAFDRGGAPVRTNYDPEEDTAHNSVFQQYESYCVSEDFHTIRNYVTKNWNEFPVFHDLPVLSEYYAAKNYHHFKVRFLPQVRRYADSAETQIGVPDELLALPFQRELIGRTYGSRNILPLPIVFRVVNPILSYDPISSDGVAWLREHVGLRAERGRRRIYIRRGGSLVGRRGGGVVETPEFLAFLARHNFETISFGGGELPIAEQVALLNGAGIVMSAHGASLTNIAYLDPGVSIIEIFGKHWCHHSHIQLAMHVGLRHSGVISEIDDQLNLRVDMRRLEAAFERSLQA